MNERSRLAAASRLLRGPDGVGRYRRGSIPSVELELAHRGGGVLLEGGDALRAREVDDVVLADRDDARGHRLAVDRVGRVLRVLRVGPVGLGEVEARVLL